MEEKSKVIDMSRVEYTLTIDGEEKLFCKECGSEIDIDGCCYCHR